MEINAEIEGLDEALRKLSPELYAKPLRDFFKKASIYISDRAKELAPVDTGRLRSSLTYNVDDADPPQYAQVGTNVEYAPYMEFGTGLLTDGEGGAGVRHWPPADALDVWASRHGFASGAHVARIIGMRGGLEPRRYLRNAFEQAKGAIEGFLKDMKEDILAGWGNE